MIPIEETGYSQYTGTGSRTLFEYGFTVIEDSDVRVLVDGVVPVYEKQSNGVVITPAPVLNAVVELYRYTDVTQLRDWVPFDSFDAEWTEDACDKLIMLKQEVWYRLQMNLASEHLLDRVILHNDKGTDAHIFLWNEIDPLDDVIINEAGVFAGEATEDMPEPGTYVLKPEDFAYFQWGAAPVFNELVVTSTLYPIEVLDQMDFGGDVLSGYITPIPEEHIDTGGEFVSATLTLILNQIGPYDEAINTTGEFVSALMESELSERTFDEAIDTTGAFVSADMERILIFTQMPDESMDFAGSLVDGSMNPTGFSGSNLITQSSNLNQTGWVTTQSPISSYNQVGVEGDPNTATYLEDNSGSTNEFKTYYFDATSGNTLKYTARFFIKKQVGGDGNNPDFAALALGFESSPGTGWSPDNQAIYEINSITGVAAEKLNDVGGSVLVREYSGNADWWEVLIDGTNPNIRYIGIFVAPAYATVWDGPNNVAAQGWFTVGNVELYSNTAKEAVSGGPVYNP